MLDKRVVDDVITAAQSTGADFAEVFVEDRLQNSLSMQDRKVESALVGRDFGVGIRVFQGFNSVYVYTNEDSRDQLVDMARQAAGAIKDRGSAGNGSADQPTDLTLHPDTPPAAVLHAVQKVPGEVPHERRVDVMTQADAAARGYSPEISQVTVMCLDDDQSVLVANSEGRWAQDRRTRSRLVIRAVASSGTEMQTGMYGPGTHQGFEFFEQIDLDRYAREAARIAVAMLHAEPCPSGRFPVIIDNEFGGVIFHEACGHGMEATAVAKKASVFADKLGERVARDIVTYIDDGTLPNLWGSQTLDDEGEPTRKNVLIDKGILTGYLIDKLNARRMQMPITGSSRRESYKFAPTSRMTNTYIAPGTSTPEEIIADTEFAIYARYMGGGSVNPATGAYNFAVMEGYIVRNGKVEEPVRGATLIGTGIDTLGKVDMVGNNVGHGQGMCGASSGSLPVNVGQPMIRVGELTVGGSGRKGS